MRTSISILDNDYREWVKTLATRYKNSQIKAAVKVNSEKLFFNWLLGRDIVEMHVEERWGESVIMQLSKDLRLELSGVEGLSKSNIYYCKKFYLLYNQCDEFFQQLVGKIEKAMLPEPMSDLAQEITKDPYNFAFAGITGKYNETLLKSQLLRNITDFLIELGTGFAYVGKEYRLQIGQKEKFIDLLFYHLNLRCYIVIEVKMGEFDFQDAGQLGGYVASVNHILKRDDDNPTIGLLICKSKDNLLAQYALESSSQPIGISDFELEKLYPSKVDGMIPTIKEIEEKLK